MRNLILLTTCLLLLHSCQSNRSVKETSKSSKTDFTQYVNPFIGTSKMGHTFSGAIAPFGLVQLSPQTNFEVMFNDDGSYNGEPMNTALATNIEIPLTITANNQSKRSIYVDKILVNGEVLEGTLLSHDVIINGGEIVFEMSSTPDQ